MDESTPLRGKFPDRLRQARTMRGLSQAELAERAGFQPSAISHFETGGRAPSFENLKRLADALNVSTDYLVGRAEEPTGAASGPDFQALFRDAGKLTHSDLEALAEMARALANKRKQEPRKGT